MPIVDPGDFTALGLVPFQINLHCANALPAGHRGATCDERTAEYLVAHPGQRVLGVPEGYGLCVTASEVTLHGMAPAVVFDAGPLPRPWPLPGRLEPMGHASQSNIDGSIGSPAHGPMNQT